MATRKSKRIAALAVIGSGMLAVTACGSPAQNAAAPTANKTTGKVTITWAAGTITGNGLRKTLIAAFEKAYPNIKVTIIPEASSTDTTRATLSTQISGGSQTPDVYLGDVIWPGQFGSEQLAVPLNKHLPNSFFSRFAPGLVQGASYKGNVYGAPFFMDAGFLYYRKDLLAEAGLPVPKTWEQLKSESLTLENKHLVKYGFVWEGSSYEGLTCDWMEYLADAGGQVFNAAGQPTMNSPAATHALTFMRSLITSGASPKAVTTFQEPQAMNAFDQGQAAFLRNWDYAYSNSQTPGQSRVVGKVGVVPLPTFAGHGNMGYACIGGWDMYINPHSQHMAQDLTFINFMTGQYAQNILATKFSMIPTNGMVQNDPKVKAMNPVLAIVPKTRLVSRPSQTPYYAKVSQAIYSNLNAALAGETSVKQALNNANAQVKSATSSSSL